MDESSEDEEKVDLKGKSEKLEQSFRLVTSFKSRNTLVEANKNLDKSENLHKQMCNSS